MEKPWKNMSLEGILGWKQSEKVSSWEAFRVIFKNTSTGKPSCCPCLDNVTLMTLQCSYLFYVVLYSVHDDIFCQNDNEAVKCKWLLI